MAEKLSWTELRRALAKRAGVSEKTAGAFLNAVQAQLMEALKTDKQVKINGLGTFKVQAVAPRKSVNVTTGEEIIIEGYNKLAFTPEAGVRELIESQEPGVKSQEADNASVIDPIQKLGAQAEEIVDILGDLGQSPKEEPVAEPEPVVEEPEPVIEEPAPAPEPVAEPEPIYFPGATPAAEPEPEIIVQRPKKEKKKSHFWRDTLICVIILLLLLAGGYFFLRQELSDIIRSFIAPAETEEVIVGEPVLMVEEPAVVEEPAEEEPAEEPAPAAESAPAAKAKSAETAMIPKGKIPQEQILAEFLAASGETLTGTADYPNLITVEAMHEGSRLTWMSKRFYGKKVYWPYLYDANRDVIDNPNQIETGTPLRVPKLTKAQMDTTSTAFLQLKQEAEAACKK